jgi:hypothetical protein
MLKESVRLQTMVLSVVAEVAVAVADTGITRIAI